MSQALADGEEPPLPEGAKERAYIDTMANEAGITGSEFVATTIGTLSATTGMVLVNQPGVRLIDATLGENLDNLLSAADYPDWETLTEEEKASYSTAENYNSIKYMSLMEAFDLNDGFNRFEQTGSSGGGFVFTDEESSRLKRLGNIGKNWTNRIGQSIDDLRGILAPDYLSVLENYLGYGIEESNTINASDYEDWKSTLPQSVSYSVGNLEYVRRTGGGGIRMWTNTDVYLIGFRSNVTSTTNYLYTVFMFSKTPFLYNYRYSWNDSMNFEQPTIEPSYKKFNEYDEYYYVVADTQYYEPGNFTTNLVMNESTTTNQQAYNNTYEYAMHAILYDNRSSGGTSQMVPDIPDYPVSEEVPSNTVVYYPQDGITPSTTWNQYITVQRPDNPFNPDDETSTPEWKQETKQNIQGLQGIRFDKLFPFCLYYDLQKFWQKVQAICGIQTSQNGTISTQATSAYDEIELRFYIPGVMDDIWTFDLEPLRNILLIVKPFMLVFLIGVEIISLIMLWKGILTGQ